MQVASLGVCCSDVRILCAVMCVCTIALSVSEVCAVLKIERPTTCLRIAAQRKALNTYHGEETNPL